MGWKREGVIDGDSGDTAWWNIVACCVILTKVRVEILDINDNYPAFPHSHTTVYVSEATLPRQLLFPVQSAYDIDSPRYGVVGYKLIEDSTSTTSGTFQLTVNSTAAGGFDVRVMLRGNLDRERQAFYQIQVGLHVLCIDEFRGPAPTNRGSPTKPFQCYFSLIRTAI